MLSSINYVDDDGNQVQLIEEDDGTYTKYTWTGLNCKVEKEPPPTCSQITYSGMLKAPLSKYDPSLHDPQMPLSFGDNWEDDTDWPTPNPTPSNPYVATNTLKCKCWVCQTEFSPTQRYDYSTGKTHISMAHCGRNASIFLTAKEIEDNNNTGFYQAFLFIY